jgi:hypothetical protein
MAKSLSTTTGCSPKSSDMKGTMMKVGRVTMVQK